MSLKNDLRHVIKCMVMCVLLHCFHSPTSVLFSCVVLLLADCIPNLIVVIKFYHIGNGRQRVGLVFVDLVTRLLNF